MSKYWKAGIVGGIGVVIIVVVAGLVNGLDKSREDGVKQANQTFTPLVDPQGFYVDLSTITQKPTSDGMVVEQTPSAANVTQADVTETLQPVTPVTQSSTVVAVPPTVEGEAKKTPNVPQGNTPVPTATESLNRTLVSGPIRWQRPGVELINIDNSELYPYLEGLGIGWIRYNGVLWSEVEPSQGERKWERLAKIESGLALASSRNLNVILIVRSTPLWAQKVDGSFCGAVKRGKFEAFGDFMYDLVKRYSVPPYSVKYWEIGNEPDVDPALVAKDSAFGCWGDEGDVYYGGEYYAEMLKSVYPMIKLADPDAKVLLGGLLLDCDPTLPNRDKPCPRGNFLEGVLRNDGGNYFDIISYHAYPAYLGDMLSVTEYSDWERRGGILMGKVDFMREVMSRYGVDKPLMNTETSFLCPEWSKKYCLPPKEDFFDAQADYVPRLYVRNLAAGVLATYWYAFDDTGWRYSSVLEGNRTPKPAYTAYVKMREFLEETEYQGALDLPEGLEGYIFQGGQKKVWVVWSQEDSLVFLPKPEGFLGAYDKFGNSVSLEIDQIPIRRPVYILLAP